MSDEIQLPVTQRAYTLRLDGLGKDGAAWRDCLWRTHEAVNAGVRAFADWLLTLRGGLCHTLADEAPIAAEVIEREWDRQKKEAKKADKPEPTPDEAQRTLEEARRTRIRDKRVLLALSWLSVESEAGAPAEHLVPHQYDRQTGERSGWQTVEALRGILKDRAVPDEEIEEWAAVCRDSLQAPIRDDAVWVNRCRSFDTLRPLLDGLTRDYATQTILSFFGPAEDYFSLPDAESENESFVSGDEGPDFRSLARQWISTNFGTGEKSDNAQISDALAKFAKLDLSEFIDRPRVNLVAHLVGQLSCTEGDDQEDALRIAIGWRTGRKSKGRLALESLPAQLTKESIDSLQQKFAEEAEDKRSSSAARDVPSWMPKFREGIEKKATGMPFVLGRNLIGEYSVMLDHAARRVSIAHSWIKRAEERRRQFDEDARLIHQVPSPIIEWLDKFRAQRAKETGAEDGFRIRRRALSGWKQVVAKWNSIRGATAEERVKNRVDAVHEIQAEMQANDEKFGEEWLFKALAVESAHLVWNVDGEGNPQPLLDYAAAREAEVNKKRFKVPAFRHPDPLLHPVFCDFGESRWTIKFSAHQATARLEDAERTVTRKQEDVQKAEARLNKAKTDAQRAEAQDALNSAKSGLARATQERDWLQEAHGVTLTLWNGSNVEDVELRWHSKRLVKDLGISSSNSCDIPTEVVRADRMGRAIAGASSGSPICIAGLFDLKEWNGRLQAPRRQLDDIAAVRDGKKLKELSPEQRRETVKYLIGNISWLISFSAKLQPQGPWLDFAARWEGEEGPKHDRRGGFATNEKLLCKLRLFSWKWEREANDFIVDLGDPGGKDPRGLTFPFSNPTADNAIRGGQAKLSLCRLPGLRVLSVDLGHRFAASCAVWETLPLSAMMEKIAGREIVAGGTGEHDLYCHVATPTNKIAESGRNKGKPVTEIIVYRRIGTNKLPDGSDHPAPWARLERQFLIKLQGEETKARWATQAERTAVEDFEAALDRSRGVLRKAKQWRLDDLMADAVRTAELGLRRHADRARIAHYLTAIGKPRPGGPPEAFTADGRGKCLMDDVLIPWCELASSQRWRDPQAAELWQEFIIERMRGPELPKPHDDEEGREWRERLQAFKPGLEQVVRQLASDPSLCERIRAEWVNRWSEDDGDEAEARNEKDANGKRTGKTIVDRPATGWHARLRWLADWILGRHKGDDIRRAGGMSLRRVTTLTALYQLQKKFRMRPVPDDLRRNIPQKGDDALRQFSQQLLDVRDQLRENRVKQLASRVASAALGLAHPRPVESRKRETRLARHKRLGKIERRFPSCHAVVIENLSNYRPDETRTRRENRQLMSWSSSKVKKYLAEACQLYGLHLREVQASYTSRQDSRTGAPGVRCHDFPVTDFVTQSGFLWKHVKRSLDKVRERSTDQEHLYIRDLLSNWNQEQRIWTDAAGNSWVLGKEDRWLGQDGEPQDKQRYKSPPPVRLLWKGGELFISAEPGGRDGVAIQADLNAAANIGLRALLDPDWQGRWWYVPAILAEDGYRIPNPDKCSGATCLEDWRIAQDKDGYTAQGNPLRLADEQDVKQAQADFERADAVLKAAKKERKRAMKGKGNIAPEQADHQVEEAEGARKLAKRQMHEVKKAAQAKHYLNLWRDPSDSPLSDGAWYGYSEYENRVRNRVVHILRRHAKLADNFKANTQS